MLRLPFFSLAVMLALSTGSIAFSQNLIDSLRKAIEAPCQGSDSARLLNQLSQAYLRVAPDSTRAIASVALSTAKRNQQPRETGWAYLNFGQSDFVQSRLSLAQQYYLKALPLFIQHGDSAGLCEYHISMGNLAFQKENWEEAGTAYRKALKIAEEKKLIQYINRSQNNIAMVYLKTGYLEAAETIFISLQKSYETEDNKQGKAIVYNNLGEVRRLMNKDEGEVIGLYLKSVSLQREIQDKVGLANSYITISKLYESRKQLEKALNYAQFAFSMYDTLYMGESMIKTGLTLSKYLKELGKPDEALQYAKRARNQALQNNLFSQLLQCDLMLARYYLDRKDYQHAEDCIDEAGPLAATSRDATAQKTLHTLEAELRKHLPKD